MEKFPKQECIPVRFVPPTAVAIGGVSASDPLGDPPGCGPGDPQVWAWRPPPGQTPQLPPGCGPGDPRPDPSTFPWVWA